MTKEEIEARIKFLKSKIAENSKLIDSKDIMQYALKILINSGYGAISSSKNPIGDTDLANAITTCGSTSIKQVNVFAREFVKMKNPNISDKDLESVVIFNDTDSCCIRLDKCGVKLCEGDVVTDEGYKLVQECDDYINTSFENWFKEVTGSDNCTLYFKREKICDAGIFLKKKDSDDEAKKNYILHILDNEGVKKPSFKYTGVKFARSTLSGILKDAGKKVAEHMILTQDKSSTENVLRELYNKFEKMDLNDIVTIQRCNNINKHSSQFNYKETQKFGRLTYPKGTPGHVKAAMNFNIVLEKLGLNKYEKVKSGDMAKIIYIHPKNKFAIDRIGFLDEWPKEFDEYFQIDYATTFVKTVFDEVRRLYNSVDWSPFHPHQGFECSVWDLFEME